MNQARLILPDESQKKVCAKYGLPLHTPEEIVAIALDTLDKSPLYGTRTISWFIHGGEHSAESGFYQALHTSHLAEMLPEVVKYLFLPEGAKFIIDREGYEDIWMAESDKETD